MSSLATAGGILEHLRLLLDLPENILGLTLNLRGGEPPEILLIYMPENAPPFAGQVVKRYRIVEAQGEENGIGMGEEEGV